MRTLKLPKSRVFAQFLPLLAVASMTAVVSAACGGNNEGDNGNGGNGDQAAQEALLASMVLTGEDVPEGLVETGRTFESNEEAADRASEPGMAMRRFETWGRELGLTVTFLVDPQATGQQTFLGMRSDATLFEDDRGARLSYQFDVDRAREAEPAEVGLADVEIVEIEAPNVGEEAYWLRITGVSTDEAPDLMVVDQILFRQGQVVGFLRADSRFLSTAPRNSGEGQVLNWAQTVSSRVEDAQGE